MQRKDGIERLAKVGILALWAVWAMWSTFDWLTVNFGPPEAVYTEKWASSLLCPLTTFTLLLYCLLGIRRWFQHRDD